MNTSGNETSGSQPVRPPQTPEEYLARQSAESEQASHKIEILDKIRTSNMIFRGQKLLDRFRTLTQNKTFGLKPEQGVDVPVPEDVVQFDCKTETHHHHAPPAPVAAAPGLMSSLLKIGVGAALAGTGVGVPFALPGIISGVRDLMKPAAAVAPATPPVPPQTPATKPVAPAPSLIIGGQKYELRLGKDTE